MRLRLVKITKLKYAKLTQAHLAIMGLLSTIHP
jgi:hypothetical protein